MSVTVKGNKNKLQELGAWLNQQEGYPNAATMTERYVMEDEEKDGKFAYLLPDSDETRATAHLPSGCTKEKGDTRNKKRGD